MSLSSFYNTMSSASSPSKPRPVLALIGLILVVCVAMNAERLQTRELLSTKETVATPANNGFKKFDGFNTPSVQCRLGLEQWQNDNIDWWMKHPPYPLVEWIWELTDPKTNRTYYQGYLHVLLCGKGDCSQKRAEQIQAMNWTWKDQHGDTYALPSTSMTISNPSFPKTLFRLDPPNPDCKPSKLWPTVPGNSTIGNDSIPVVYDLEPYVKCSTVEKENPPPPTAKIGACITRFWGQHDLMPEWIAHHRMVGIQHFYFFVQEPFDSIQHTMPPHERDISYIPYKCKTNNKLKIKEKVIITSNCAILKNFNKLIWWNW